MSTEIDHIHDVKCTVCDYIQEYNDCLHCPCGRFFCKSCHSEIPKELLKVCLTDCGNFYQIMVQQNKTNVVENA